MPEIGIAERKDSQAWFPWTTQPARDGTDVETRVLRLMTAEPSLLLRLALGALAAVFLWGLGAWAWQIKNGLEVTGLNVPVFWGLYIVNFVFFIGVSHAGTLISAILRNSRAQWRSSITRSADVITAVFSTESESM